MKLFTLFRGRAKNRLKPIMIDEEKKVLAYQKALQSSDKGGKCKTWWYDIKPCTDKDAKPWRKHNNYGQWTNYNSYNPPLVKNGSRS